MKGNRVTTGLLFGIVMLSVLFSGQKVAAPFFLIPALLSVNELLRLLDIHKNKSTTATIFILSVFLYCIITSSLFFSFNSKFLYSIILIPWIAEIVIMLSQKKNHTQSFIASLIAPYIIVMPFSFISFFYSFSTDMGLKSFVIPVAFFAFLWGNDMFAYFTGKALGKTPLLPSVSPKKTVEGTIGGICFSLLASVGLYFLMPEPGIFFWLGFAALTAVGATFGDLLESAMKRRLGVKDSGKSLPGHGGFLDRFDSMFMAASIIFVFLKLVS